MTEKEYPDMQDAAASPSGVSGQPSQVPHEQLARRLGISEKTVRRKRQLGMSDEQIAAESAIKSVKNDPLKHKREAPLALPAAAAPTPDMPPLLAAIGEPVPSMGDELKALNLRRERAAAEWEELKLDKERGVVIPVAQAELDFSNAFREIKDGVLGMADRLCTRLAVTTDPGEIRRIVLEDAKQTLSIGEKTLEQYQTAVEAAGRNAERDSAPAIASAG